MRQERMTVRPINENVLAAVSKLQCDVHADAALIYGSYADGTADELSDVDVLFAIHKGKERHGYLEECGFWLDYKCLTFDQVREDLKSAYAMNHVPMMNALIDGIIVLDCDNALSELQQQAKALWNGGPSSPESRELYAAKVDIMKMVHNAERALARATRGALPSGLARIKIDQMFFGIVGRYQRIHLVWSSSVLGMYKHSRTHAPGLFSFLEAYGGARDDKTRMEVLHSLADSCFKSINLRKRA